MGPQLWTNGWVEPCGHYPLGNGHKNGKEDHFHPLIGTSITLGGSLNTLTAQKICYLHFSNIHKLGWFYLCQSPLNFFLFCCCIYVGISKIISVNYVLPSSAQVYVGGWWGVQSHFHVKPNLVFRLGWGFDNIEKGGHYWPWRKMPQSGLGSMQGICPALCVLCQ